MEAQLENSQEEVTTGAQGTSSGHKEPRKAKTARNGQKGLFDTNIIIDQEWLINGFRLNIS